MKLFLFLIFLFITTANAAEPQFIGRVKTLPTETLQAIKTYSWHPGCPLDPTKLSYVEVSHWGFDHKVHQGVLIVNHRVAKEVVEIFKELFQIKFPIEKIEPIDYYHGDDKQAMMNNDSSAFLCRKITLKPFRFSKHSYGLAIDINPIQNPYVVGNHVMPPKGKSYLNRKNKRIGMITKGDAVYKIFKKHGWRWGGDWRHIKDYQHFEKSG